MITLVEEHNVEAATASESMKKYLDTINRFLKDSKKRLKFDDTGTLSFQLMAGGKLRPVHALSSGEAQLIVLLTHLYFDPAAQAANVFIIDEPELSLHVAWQELFVDSLLSANPSIQYVLATHSPSIILDRIGACRDLGDSAHIDIED
jgi:predicted ATP-binding protein involved in virulence